MDVLAREQYLDFVRGRRFRQSLLCHANLRPDRELEPARLAGMSVIAPKLASDRGLVFPAVAPDAADTSAPAADGLDDARAIVHAITAAWPQPVTVRPISRGPFARAFLTPPTKAWCRDDWPRSWSVRTAPVRSSSTSTCRRSRPKRGERPVARDGRPRAGRRWQPGHQPVA